MNTRDVVDYETAYQFLLEDGREYIEIDINYDGDADVDEILKLLWGTYRMMQGLGITNARYCYYVLVDERLRKELYEYIQAYKPWQLSTKPSADLMIQELGYKESVKLMVMDSSGEINLGTYRVIDGEPDGQWHMDGRDDITLDVVAWRTLPKGPLSVQ